jgi:DNA-binding response OmpR family regulator
MIKYNYSILYVENDESVSSMTLQYLKKHFRTIYSTDNGEEALEIYEKKKPNIIITAVKIPKINGLELSYKIRKENKNIPIIIISAYSTTEYLLKAIELRLIKYLIKPIDERKLLNAINISIQELNNKSIIYINGGYQFDLVNKVLTLNDNNIPLRSSHKLLLELLIKNKNRAVSYIELENYIWGYNVMSEAAIRSLIYDIRAILGKNIIQNISKIGYKIILQKN